MPAGSRGPTAGDGRFEITIITGDDERHVLPASAVSVTAVVALTQAVTVMMWDPPNRTLIAANVVGQTLWTVWDGNS
jgi:hypothetical protein